MAKHVAVVGATGAVGTEMLLTLEKRNFPVGKLTLLASRRSAGKTLSFRGESIPVRELTKNAFQGVEVALFSAGADRSKEFGPAAVAAGAVVVDNSSAFRMDRDVPLVVPEVNPGDVRLHKGLIANPNCSTIIMLVAVNPIYRAVGISRIVCSTYQAASGAGAQAMAELEQQTRDYLDRKPLTIAAFAHQIAFNLFPHIANFGDNGYTQEEMKLVNESRKMWHDDTIRITGTTVRVPVLRAHSESINLTLKKPLSADDARKLLAAAPGVTVVDDPAAKRYPMPKDASGQDNVLVGRIRKDISQDNGLEMFVSGDQLLKGAALNAVQIAEML